jgi:hypothetical protein
MQLKKWLNSGRGRATALAAHLNVTAGRISQMATDGVPVKFMQSVSLFTQGDVSIEEMVEGRTPVAVEIKQPAPSVI